MADKKKDEKQGEAEIVTDKEKVSEVFKTLYSPAGQKLHEELKAAKEEAAKTEKEKK